MIIRIIKTRRPKRNRNNIKAVICLILFSCFLFTLIYIAKTYNDSYVPIAKQVARYKAEQISTEAISIGVMETLSKTKINYEDIVTVTKNTDGTLTSLSVNLFKLNKLKSEVTVCINNLINEKETVKTFIPLGNVVASMIGVDLLSGLGPRIPLELMPSGNTFVDFDNNFTAVGINQTKHTVSLKITSRISMVLPNNLTVSSKTVSFVPIAESIIVGDIPDTYTVLETSDETLRDDILNLQ